MVEQVTLNDLIYKAKNAGDVALTENQKIAMVELFGKGCREKTKNALYRRLKYLSLLKPHGIFSRVIINDIGRIEYVPGQDYIAEVRAVRACILE
ncbi:hypothetical protein EOM86_13610 [Candidatus Nomurabacteria bacterium]|nr:hypothetical protein [Candidatus Nomurabacteria bacterium]